MEKQVQFELVSKQDGVVVGKLEGEEWPGVYLSSDFLDRLGEIQAALTTRLAKMDTSEVPVAEINLLGVLGRMFSVYAKAVQPGRDARHEEQMAKATEALNRVKELLDGFSKR